MISIELKGGIIFKYHRVLDSMKNNGVKFVHISSTIEKHHFVSPPFLFIKIMLITKDN